MKGCYKLISYPAHFKHKKKGNANTAYNVHVENCNPNIPAGGTDRNEIPNKMTAGDLPREP